MFEFLCSIFKGPAVTSHSCRLRASQAFFYFTACLREDRPVELKCDQQQSEGHLLRLICFFCLIVQFTHVADEMVPLVSSAVPLSLRRQYASTSCLACANKAKHWCGTTIQSYFPLSHDLNLVLARSWNTYYNTARLPLWNLDACCCTDSAVQSNKNANQYLPMVLFLAERWTSDSRRQLEWGLRLMLLHGWHSQRLPIQLQSRGQPGPGMHLEPSGGQQDRSDRHSWTWQRWRRRWRGRRRGQRQSVGGAAALLPAAEQPPLPLAASPPQLGSWQEQRWGRRDEPKEVRPPLPKEVLEFLKSATPLLWADGPVNIRHILPLSGQLPTQRQRDLEVCFVLRVQRPLQLNESLLCGRHVVITPSKRLNKYI